MLQLVSLLISAVTGTGIAPGARIVGIAGTTVYLDKANVGAVSGNSTFQTEVGEDLAVGMVVSQTGTTGVQGGAPNGIDANTVITGIDHVTYDDAGAVLEGQVTVYLNNALIDNIRPSNNNDEVEFDFSKVTATAHGLTKVTPSTSTKVLLTPPRLLAPTPYSM